jgi:glutaredoxin
MSEDFVVYSKTDCKFCDLSKQLLLDEGFGYEIVMCDNYLKDDREGFLKRMEEKIGRPYNTFPMVFYKERFVGGYKELVKKVEELACFK